jgi:hypothetical protein
VNRAVATTVSGVSDPSVVHVQCAVDDRCAQVDGVGVGGGVGAVPRRRRRRAARSCLQEAAAVPARSCRDVDDSGPCSSSSQGHRVAAEVNALVAVSCHVLGGCECECERSVRVGVCVGVAPAADAGVERTGEATVRVVLSWLLSVRAAPLPVICTASSTHILSSSTSA